MEKEIWKDVLGLEGKYKVSNRGNVKSLDRYICIKRSNCNHLVKRFYAGRLLIPHKYYVTGSNKTLWYLAVKIKKRNVRDRIHSLVAEVFIPNPQNLPHINHKNGIKTDNRVENLEWVNVRENMSHAYKYKNKSSKYPGVSWAKRDKKWEAYINIKLHKIHLGHHDTEEEAHQAYKRALKQYGLKNKYANFD